MSECQYYEFLAIDRPLNNAQQAEVSPPTPPCRQRNATPPTPAQPPHDHH